MSPLCSWDNRSISEPLRTQRHVPGSLADGMLLLMLRLDMCDLLENLLDILPLPYSWRAIEHPMGFSAFWRSREKPVETPPKESLRLGK